MEPLASMAPDRGSISARSADCRLRNDFDPLLQPSCGLAVEVSFHSSGVQRLYGFNGFVRHPLHQALDIAFGTLPLVLAGLSVPIAASLGFAIVVQLILQHANVDYRLGPAQKLLAIGPVHRLHHVNWAGEG